MRPIPLILVVALSFPAPLLAQPAASPATAKPVTGRHVGIVAAVKGSVKINSQTQVGRVIGSGEPIYLNDEISTDEKGSLQILLLDQTTFSIGPNSTIVIDKFVYDPDTHDGEVKAKVVKGVFRFVTGKIGQKKPNQMAVDLPVGTIGIRGTIVAGESNGSNSMVALLGPGANNNTQHRDGSFSLQNSVGGTVKESVVSKTGFGATIDETGEPSSPFQVPEADLNRLASAVAPSSGSSDSSSSSSTGSGSSDSGDGDSEGDGESPTQQAGQDVAMAGETSQALMGIQVAGNTADSVTSTASQETTEELIDDLYGFFSTISTYEQLRSIPSGQFHYSQLDVPIYNSSSTQVGNYDVFFNIDFGARTVGGGNSKWVVNLNDSGFVLTDETFSFSGEAFTAGSGFAIFDDSETISAGVAAGCSPSDCTAELTLVLHNNGGTIAANMTSVIALENPNNSKEYYGAESGTPRSPGLTA